MKKKVSGSPTQPRLQDYRPAKRRTSPGGTVLWPKQIAERAVDQLANELPETRGHVAELVNHYGEVWHHFEFLWGRQIPFNADVVLEEGVEVVDVKTVFEMLAPIFLWRYRAQAQLLVFVVTEEDRRGAPRELGWRTISMTTTARAAFETAEGSLDAIDSKLGGNKANESKYSGALGVGVYLEAPKWYGRISAKQADKYYHRRKGRDAKSNKNIQERARKTAKRAQGKRPKKHPGRRRI